MITETLKKSETLKSPRTAYLISKSNSGVQPVSIDSIGRIGRDATNEIEIADPFVSSFHSRIDQTDGEYVIRDLDSKNGTFVNGTKIRMATLQTGDVIRVGEREFIFSLNPAILKPMKHLSSHCAPWNETLNTIPSFSQTDLPVLLLGESGVGKEVIAHEVHAQSRRSDGPFVSVNCSALSETLIESELFGHTKGSFTGATNNRQGAFQAAKGGTLFLDEIGDLPIDLQPKLLRALENKEIRPVGADQNVKTDVRVIAATHRDIPLLIKDGLFRADLYFRINVIKLEIPPLRERMEDFERLLFDFSREMRVRFSNLAITELKKHPWTGNIRELKNTVARASAMFPHITLEPEHLDRILEKTEPDHPGGEWISGRPQRSVIKELERKAIYQKLVEMNGNQRRTAMALGLPKSTLHDKIKSFGIDLKAIKSG